MDLRVRETSGWVEFEHLSYGVPLPGLAERFSRLEEQVEIIDAFAGVEDAQQRFDRGIYLQLLDLSDLDHLELIASEVAPQV